MKYSRDGAFVVNTAGYLVTKDGDYVLNQNLSEQRFVYDAPSSANNYNNFLFSE